ncbi:MAG: sodium:solute symporter [Opitutae bacterium]|nr:sodium:solute symporter [Opitutae bacterium]
MSTGSTTFAPHSLTTADYVCLALYFAVNLAIGWWCRRRSRSTANSYFLGSGRVVWWAAAVSFFATSVSSISFMALPAKSFKEDWLAIGSAPAQSCAGMLTGFVFVGIFRRLNMTTVFDYLERRFDRRVRYLGAGLAIVLKVIGRMSIVMLLPALALATVTGLNVYLSILLMGVITTIYAMEGGFEAVVWTDVLQSAVMVGGVTIAIYHMAAGVPGGLGGIVDTASSAGKLHAVSWDFDFTKPTVWVFVGMFLATVFFQISDQPLMQRMLATADERDAKRTVTIGNFIGLLSGFVFFFVGTALWTFYRAHPERLANQLSGDTIFPYFIVNELPHGVIGVIIAGLFAAAMGALSSALNSSATVIVSDFYGTLRPNLPVSERARLGWWVTLICGGIATVMALFLAWRNVPSLWDEFLRLAALLGGGFPGVFALGLLSRRANGSGVMVGAVASIALTWWVQTFTPISVFFHTFVAISCTMLVGYVASLLFASRAPAKNLRGLTVWDLKNDRATATAPRASATASSS